MPTTPLSLCSINFFLCTVWISATTLCAEGGIYTRNYFLNLGGQCIDYQTLSV